MRVPRFRISSLLAIVALIGFWLATFSMPDQPRTGEQFRLAIPFVACIASGFAAIYFRGGSRAFWAAFFVTLTLLYGQLQFRSPIIPSVLYIASSWGGGTDGIARLVTYSLWILLLFGISALVGVVVVGIYNRSLSEE
jgi:hypothetical protein